MVDAVKRLSERMCAWDLFEEMANAKAYPLREGFQIEKFGEDVNGDLIVKCPVSGLQENWKDVFEASDSRDAAL